MVIRVINIWSQAITGLPESMLLVWDKFVDNKQGLNLLVIRTKVDSSQVLELATVWSDSSDFVGIL